MKKGLLACGFIGLLGLLLLGVPAKEAKAGGLTGLVDRSVSESPDSGAEPQDPGAVADMLNGVGQTVEDTVEVSGQTVEDVVEVTGQTVEDVVEVSGQTIEDAVEVTDRTVDGLLDTTGNAVEELAETGDDPVNTVDDVLDNPPLSEAAGPLLEPVEPLLDKLQPVKDRKPVSGMVEPLVDLTNDRFEPDLLEPEPDKPLNPTKDLLEVVRPEPTAPAVPNSDTVNERSNAAEAETTIAEPEAATPATEATLEASVQPVPQTIDRPIPTVDPIESTVVRDVPEIVDEALYNRPGAPDPVSIDTVSTELRQAKPATADDEGTVREALVEKPEKKAPLLPIRKPIHYDWIAIAPIIAPGSSAAGGQNFGGTDSGPTVQSLSILSDAHMAYDEHAAPHWLQLLFLKDQYAQAPPLMPPRVSFFAAVAR